MAYEKIIFVLLFATALILVANVSPTTGYNNYNRGKNISHNFIIGSRRPGDRLVMQQNITASASTFKIVTRRVQFLLQAGKNITQLAALDQKIDGTGAYVTLESGGVGKRNATLRFKSQRSHGIHFIVKIFAR
ncbi:probable salivary secreted peptide [Leptopilina heterotoma]|uniref:probable salivary secreted peptide n=1 Tax=Leptopilina heterotoma TaxID=63436 RepID=UPI001CA7D433|nr:probable salivary secreted peptide [Leptopilina heterotoma]